MIKSLIDRLSDNLVLSDEYHGKPYQFYGANQQLFSCIDQEIMLSGAADTGKTIAALTYLNQLAWKYPNSQWAIVRKYAATLPGTVLQSFLRKVTDMDDGIVPFGGERRPERFIYPNGSVIWVGGLDKASKVLSSERDGIYVNQAEELENTDWEYLVTRASGRAGNMIIDGVPRGIVFGDCNPASPLHWILQRAKQGKLTLLESTHKDNPEIYDPVTGLLTEGGKQRLSALQRLTGANYNRLFKGIWAQPEGAILDVFDEERHVIPEQNYPRHYPRVVGVDPLGAYTAALWAVFDPEHKIIVIYREYYQPFGLTIPGHARNILTASGFTELGYATDHTENIVCFVGGGPSERQARLDFSGAGLHLVESPIIGVWDGIDRIIQLLNEYKLLVTDNCINLRSEIGEYRRKIIKGVVTDEIEGKEKYHLIDSLRYLVGWLLPSEQTETSVGEIDYRIGNY